MQQMNDIKQKRCSKCEKTLPITDFGRRRVSKDGHRGQCKECVRRYEAEYQDHYRHLPKGQRRGDRQPIGKYRVCSTCKVRKDYSEFRPRANTPSGIDYSCRECTSKKEWEKYSKKFD